MGHVELFLLFPVYEECEGQPYYLNTIKELDNTEYFEYCSAVENVKSFLSHESFYGYYDSRNVKAFMQPIDVLEDCYPKLSMLLRMTLKNWGSDWRRNQKTAEDDAGLYQGKKIEGDTLCEVAKRQTLDAESSYLLLDNEALVHADTCIKVLFHTASIELSCREMNVVMLSDWFSKNRKPARKFHLSPKHGENGKGAHLEHKGDHVSVLLCSRENAAKLLDKAIGIDAESRTLYFYDVDNGKYIEFKHEGGNVYHGFHLDDADVKKRIPDEVVKKIEEVTLKSTI